MDNLLHDLPNQLDEELVSMLVQRNHVRIERIVSTGQSSSPGFWYDQEENEWVMLMQGEARLQFASGKTITIKPGDHVEIPAHVKHRVDWTSDKEPTVWLAVFY